MPRDTKSPGIFAADAVTTIPPTPVVGVPYRNEATGLDAIRDGWPFKTIVNSADFAQILHEVTALLDLIDRTGVLEWKDDVEYDTVPAYVQGSDGLLYRSTAPNGPSTTVVDPVGDLSGTWVKALTVADESITTAKLADLAVTAAKLADLAVTTAKIVNLAVTAGKLATNAVTTAKIANDAVDNTKLANMSGWALKLRNSSATGDPQDVKVSALTEDVAPAAGDWLLGEASSGQLRKYKAGAVVVTAGSNANGEYRVWSDGFKQFYMLTGSLAANATVTVNYPLGLTDRVIGAQVTAQSETTLGTAAVNLRTPPGLSSLQIRNSGGSVRDSVYVKVEGY